ncbi:MAG: homocysteine S-methyltransferase family protein [Acidobacteria bacterium]|nr:homocysteine S-methyltransferase family protein [Acidobacteriota bacterium]
MSGAGLLARLQRGEVVIGDGAWGTLLIAEAGLPPGAPPERVILDAPEIVGAIARRYLEAGAEILTTDTFGGTPLRLAAHGLAEHCEEINRRAVELVREAAATRALVSGSVGPTGTLLAPLGPARPAEVEAAFERQIAALAAAGADLLCVETMIDLAEALLAVQAAKRVAPAVPVVATMTFEPTPRGVFTVMGVTPARAAAALAEAGAEVVGANCGNGIEGMVAVVAELTRHAAVPVAVRPNAGLPQLVDGALVWPENPAFFAAHAPALVAAGARLLGGCCGTTPAHIGALRAVLAA